MIKFSVTTPRGRLIALGLPDTDLTRLRAGQPIKVDLQQFGLVGDVLIFAGKDEASMAHDMEEFIGPSTKGLGELD